MTNSTTVRVGRSHADRHPGLRRLGVRPTLTQYLRDLWERREFIWLIPRSDLRARSMNTMLGGIWHLLNPLLLALVFWLVFGLILEISRHPNYPAFLVIGLFVFGFTQKAFLQGARAVVNDVKLLRNINFPAAVLPLSTTISEAIAHTYALGAMFVIVYLTGETPRWEWLLVIPVAAVQMVMNLGFACVTARLTVHFRDTQQFLPYLLRIWFYLSGVLFGVERITTPLYRTIFELNPPYAFIHLSRTLIFEGTVEPRFVVYALAWATVIGVAGFVFFWQHESEYSHVAG